MEITSCSNCGQQVLPGADGNCPSCGEKMHAGNSILKKESVVYAGFWRRFGAILIDTIIIYAVAFPILYFGNLSKNYWIYSTVIQYLFYLFYNFYLVQRFEGTPGKRIFGIKIKRQDYTRIGWKEAILRESITFILCVVLSVAAGIAVSKMSVETYQSLSWWERSKKLVTMLPDWQSIVAGVYQGWMWGELLILLTNKRKRALHDFVAGTVVVKD